MTDNVTPLPDLSIVLDLDAEERDPSEVKPPYVVKVGGRTVSFADPGDIDWKDLATVNIPADMLRVALNSDDLEHIRTTPMETWKFSKLLDGYYRHFDMEKRIQAAKQQAQFSGL